MLVELASGSSSNYKLNFNLISSSTGESNESSELEFSSSASSFSDI
jgi:hypothetical protein